MNILLPLENDNLEELAMYYEGSKFSCEEMTDYTKINKLIDSTTEELSKDLALFSRCAS